MHRSSNSRSRRPRVVTIPVHFIQSEQTQSASALKIQKAFRGFLVRKSINQIKTILREVDEIERRIEDVNVIGKIDEKERFRLNETLMSLVLKLDSVRGICNGVRDCRKRVIRKAIRLQEKVDSIAAATATIGVPELLSDEDRVKVDSIAAATATIGVPELLSDEDRVKVDSTVAAASGIEPDPEEIPAEEALKTIETVDSASAAFTDFEPDPEEDAAEEALRTTDSVDSTAAAASDFLPVPEEIAAEKALKTIESIVSAAAASGIEPDPEEIAAEKARKTIESVDSAIAASGTVPDQDQVVSVTAVASDDDQVSMDEEEEPKTIHCLEEHDPSIPITDGCNDYTMNPDEEEMEMERDQRKRMGEYMLERMVEENEKLVRMMKELNEKNELQMRLLNSLAQRVEMLEKTLVCDKLAIRMKRKKTKKRRQGGGGDGDNNFF